MRLLAMHGCFWKAHLARSVGFESSWMLVIEPALQVVRRIISRGTWAGDPQRRLIMRYSRLFDLFKG